MCNFYEKVIDKGEKTTIKSIELKKVEKEGKIIKINQIVESGKTIFYLKVDSEPNNIFMIDKNINTDIVLARDGDSINLEYVSIDKQNIISVTGFTLKL